MSYSPGYPWGVEGRAELSHPRPLLIPMHPQRSHSLVGQREEQKSPWGSVSVAQPRSNTPGLSALLSAQLQTSPTLASLSQSNQYSTPGDLEGGEQPQGAGQSRHRGLGAGPGQLRSLCVPGYGDREGTAIVLGFICQHKEAAQPQ